ncbi:15409_t:CDS:10 [Acaulospora colombiana]|uniref:15409_t:CDS:1 n=1 Tax=Acaulospora colombiana TaxID=27376 RepID=A0ACA9K1P7_9GLOM|nr:15409_t:CDS:10 [Acaulospora colombiana]
MSKDLDKKVDTLAELEEELLEETPLEPQEIVQLIPSLRDALRGSQIAVSYAALECLNPFVSLIAATHPGQLKNVISAFSPAVIDKLGDAKDKVRDVALQVLLTMYSSASTANDSANVMTTLVKIIKEMAFGHKQWRVREQILQWIIVCTQQNADVSLRQWVPYMVKLLEDSYEPVRETAKDMIVLLFSAAPAHAKSDLKRELKEQSIRAGIVDYILSKVAGNQSPNDIQYDRPFDNHHTDGGSELTEDDYSNGVVEHDEVSKHNELVMKPANTVDNDIGVIYVDSTKELEREFQNLLIPFQGKESEQNWTVRERNISRMRSLIRGNAFSNYPETFINGLKLFVDGLEKSLMSLRTTLSLASAGLVRDLAVHLGSAIDPFADNILADLIKMVSSTKKIVSQAAANTANDLLQHASYHHRLVTQLWHAMEEKNIQLRSHAIVFVRTVIISHGDRRDAMERSGGAETLEKCVKKGLTDANPKVRETCREVFWTFYEVFPDRGERIMRNLEPAVKKQVERDRPKNLQPISSPTSVNPAKRPTTPSPKRPTTPSSKRPTTPSPKRPTTPSPKRSTTPGPKRPTTPGLKRPTTPASPSEERNRNLSTGSSNRRASLAAGSDSSANDNYSTQEKKRVIREQPKSASKPALRSKSPAPPSMARSKSENPSSETMLRPKSPFSPQGRRASQVPSVPRKPTIMEQLQHEEWTVRVEGIMNIAQLVVKRSLDSPYGKNGTVDSGKSLLPPDDVLSSALINVLNDPNFKVIGTFFNENVFKELSQVIQLEQMIPKVLLMARDEENPERAALINEFFPNIKASISSDKLLAVLNKCLIPLGNFGSAQKKSTGFTTPQKRRILNGILIWLNEIASTKLSEAEEGNVRGYLGEGDKFRMIIDRIVSFVPLIKETSENFEPLSNLLTTLHKLNADLFESILFEFDNTIIEIVGNIIGWEEELLEVEEEFLAKEQEREEKRYQSEEQRLLLEQQEAEKKAYEEKLIQEQQLHLQQLQQQKQEQMERKRKERELQLQREREKELEARQLQEIEREKELQKQREIEIQQKLEMEKREQEYEAQIREYERELQQKREQREQRERLLQQQREQRELWEKEQREQWEREQKEQWEQEQREQWEREQEQQKQKEQWEREQEQQKQKEQWEREQEQQKQREQWEREQEQQKQKEQWEQEQRELWEREQEQQKQREQWEREQERQKQKEQWEREQERQKQKEQWEREQEQQKQKEQWEREQEQQKQRELELRQQQEELELQQKHKEELQLQRELELKREIQLKRDQELQQKRERETKQEYELDKRYEREISERETQYWESEGGMEKQHMLLQKSSRLQKMASQPSLRRNQYRNSIASSSVDDWIKNQSVSQLPQNDTFRSSKEFDTTWDQEGTQRKSVIADLHITESRGLDGEGRKMTTPTQRLPRDSEFEERINRLRQKETAESFNERGGRSLSRNSKDSEWSQRVSRDSYIREWSGRSPQYSPRTHLENERSRYSSPREFDGSERDSSRDSGSRDIRSSSKGNDWVNQDVRRPRENDWTETVEKDHSIENYDEEDGISEIDINQPERIGNKVKQARNAPTDTLVSLPALPRGYKISEFDERDPEMKNLKELVEKLDAEDNALYEEDPPENFDDGTLQKPMSIVISEDTWKHLANTLNGDINPFFINPEDRHKNGGLADPTLTPIQEVEIPEVFQASKESTFQDNIVSSKFNNDLSSKPCDERLPFGSASYAANEPNDRDSITSSPMGTEISNDVPAASSPERTKGRMTGARDRALMPKHVQEKRLILITNLARLNSRDVDSLLFRNLSRLTVETPLANRELADDIWEQGERFGELITALIGFLSDSSQRNAEFKENALILLGQLLENQFDYATDRRLERDVLRVLLECCADKSNSTYIHATEILENYIRIVDSNGGLYALIDIMESSLFGKTQSSSQSGMKQGAFSVLSLLVKRFDRKSLERQIGRIIPLTLKGINDPKAEIRRSVVDSLVAVYSVIGDDNTLFQYLDGLNPSQLNLLNYFFNKSRNQRESIAARGVQA